MSPEARDVIHAVADVLASCTFDASSEARFQAGLESVLPPDLGFIAEYNTSAGRLDFFAPSSGVAIEAKVAGSLNDLRRQCQRYLRVQGVHAILVVTTRPSHVHAAALPGVAVYSLAFKTLTFPTTDTPAS